MNWQSCSFEEEEEEESKVQNEKSNHNMSVIIDLKEQDKVIQLRKFEDPVKDQIRQDYIALVKKFSDLFIENKFKEIAETLLTEECEVYLSNFIEKMAIQYFFGREGFLNFYKKIKIMGGEVKQTHADLERNTAFHIWSIKLQFEGEESVEDRVSMGIFTIEDSKICKYRASFGTVMPAHGLVDPLIPTRKDKMLAKVKQIGYAFAYHPDLERVASLLHDSTEYRIWSWDDMKCFTFRKADFVEGFKSLEDNYKIKCIVPYEIYSENQYAVGTYAYHLEGKTKSSGQKFVWLATSIYTFDSEFNIIKISTQGDLYPEDDATIPFEVYSRERIREKLDALVAEFQTGIDVFYSEQVSFGCDICVFGPTGSPNVGISKGLGQPEKFKTVLSTGGRKFEWLNPVDVYFDHHDPSYDVIFIVFCAEGIIKRDDFKYEKRMNFMNFSKFGFENGKLAKIVQFLSAVPFPIPSPFDDKDFEALNIKSKKDSHNNSV